MRPLSKSKLIAHRQCPKRLWLELYRPELREDSAQSVASYATGHSVGALAQALYDPRPERVVIDPYADGFDAAFARTEALLSGDAPFFEAGFRAAGALAFADVMLPTPQFGHGAWKMVEVKSSTSVKDYHRDDVAIQYFVATQAGVKLKALALAHIDASWIYPGDGDYRGLLIESDLTTEAAARANEVAGWIADAQATAQQQSEPEICTGKHCSEPFACGFIDHCTAQEPRAAHPIAWLPNVRSKALKAHLANPEVIELAKVPDELLDVRQQRVKSASLSGKAFFDTEGAVTVLKPYGLPAYFLDFETINPAVPMWAGTRPFQQIPFQLSCHHQSQTGTLEHREFLHTKCSDPSADFVAALLACCDAETSSAPIFVYNQSFEASRVRELAARFPEKRRELLTLIDRMVDLLPIVKAHYYHPSQQGSWSIKAVLPALVPELSYEQLEDVRNGGTAQLAFLELIAADITPDRRAQLAHQLREYCKLDTLAMVRVREALLRPKQ